MNTILFNFFFSLSANPAIAWSSLFISNTLIYVFIVIAAILPIIIRRDFFYSLLTMGTVATSWVLVYIIKNIFMIPRPFITLNLTPLFLESGFSFPSSHATIISALSVVIWKINRKAGVIFFVFAVLVAISRMVIGVHYPIDVIAGLCFGVIIGLCILWFYKVTNQFAFLKKYI